MQFILWILLTTHKKSYSVARQQLVYHWGRHLDPHIWKSIPGPAKDVQVSYILCIGQKLLKHGSRGLLRDPQLENTYVYHLPVIYIYTLCSNSDTIYSPRLQNNAIPSLHKVYIGIDGG
jgi:hypothetical protein